MISRTTAAARGAIFHRLLFNFSTRTRRIDWVCSFLSISSINFQSYTSSPKEHLLPLPISSVKASGFVRAVTLRCSYIWDKKDETLTNPSLKLLLLELCNMCPEIARSYIRYSLLKPDDILELLLGFQSDVGKFEIEVKKANCLWAIFKWADDQSRDFIHLSQSCKLMYQRFIQVGLVRELECLQSRMNSKGIPFDSNEPLDYLVEYYVRDGELDRSISTYDRFKSQGLVPSLSCYNLLLKFLIQGNKTRMAVRVFIDMLENGFGIGEISDVDNVILLLCKDGSIQEARSLVRKVMAFGTKPSEVIIDAIAIGYCEKKDYDDLHSFFREMGNPPSVAVGNKIIYSLCSNSDIETASSFLRELESINFQANEITFGILIGWSCQERDLKNALISLSEAQSRKLKPSLYSYNALIGGIFREGIWENAKQILDEMHDVGITPNLSTFRILLAGYFEAKQFDEVITLVGKMAELGLTRLSSIDDPLSKAFVLLGLDPVKVRRDNHKGKAEFFDNLGNGLYLHTNFAIYKKTVGDVFRDSIFPDFNSLIINHCSDGNLSTALEILNEMPQWGQELSASSLSSLLKSLCTKTIANLLDKNNSMLKVVNELDQETLNLLVQSLAKEGFTHKAMIVLEGMLQRRLRVDSKTYNSLISSLCKRGKSRAFRNLWEIARKDEWIPTTDSNVLMRCLCRKRFIPEAIELLSIAMDSAVCLSLVENLCNVGFTEVAVIVIDELRKNGFVFQEEEVYDSLITGFCNEKSFSKAFTMLNVALDTEWVPQMDTLLRLIPELHQANHDHNRFTQYLKSVVLNEQSVSLHCGLMNYFGKMGMVKEMTNVFQNILSKGLVMDSEVYNDLVQGYCRGNDFTKVREVIGILIRNKIDISIESFRKLVRFMCSNEKAAMAFNMKELIIRDNLVFYNVLIFYLLKTGNSWLVDSLLDELQEKEIQFDSYTYNFLLFGHPKCKDTACSLDYLVTVIQKGYKPSDRNIRNLIIRLCENRDLKKAMNLSREMELRNWIHPSTVQKSIVDVLFKQGKLEEGLRFLDQMFIKGLIPNNINYDTLIKRICSIGRTDRAVNLLNIMLKKGNVPNSESYDAIIQQLVSRDQLDEALDFHAEELGREMKPSKITWHMLIQRLCVKRRTEEAERLLNMMVEIGEIPSEEMYTFVIRNYCGNNNIVRASVVLKAMQQHGYEPNFGTHWSLIRNLSNSNKDDNRSSERQPFLSNLLSKSGFGRRIFGRDETQ
ncbi:pentatricopeptide repeat-containing protein At5g15280, mitochondrial [Impatiens glandulifera]|uniref:pentatricopeptide repeat-containing protein At5g15280, mitochondrial n=1 Tax=Impatiens glandulifera TaxID=253017 RepID=UPI001FB0CC09|nr:pentatricopeptide repeat-containing protein At5g15280, mitochondrial [Impatiens glandulifera]XP_047333937.1 pentatricopeptide repeat-containing protein At5g15280, mitochondrial [Impatiens glandulifera]